MRKTFAASAAFSVVLFFHTPIFASAMAPNDYIQRYNGLAMFESLRSNIPASIIMAQAIFESKWGESELARRSNNHFGIKANRSSWGGDVAFAKDDDYDAHGRLIASAFRKYGTVQESFADHTAFLNSSGRYGELFRYERDDYQNWAVGLSRCGYATDPNYAQKLIRLIETYELFKLDVPVSLSTEPGLQTTNLTITTPHWAASPAASRPTDRVEATSDGTLFEITATPAPVGDFETQTSKGPAVRMASQNGFYEINAKTGTRQNATTRTFANPGTTLKNQKQRTYRNE